MQIIIVYAWYNVWDKHAYRKSLHVVFGFVAGFFGLMAMTMIDAVASYMLTLPEAPVPTWLALPEPDDGATEHAPLRRELLLRRLPRRWYGWRHLRGPRARTTGSTSTGWVTGGSSGASGSPSSSRS